MKAFIKIEEFGPDLRLLQLQEIFVIDWSKAPSWAYYATINAAGWLWWFSQYPVVRELSWGGKEGTLYRAESGNIQYVIPIGVDWRELVEERQL